MLGIQTCSRWMVGVDETIELWRLHLVILLHIFGTSSPKWKVYLNVTKIKGIPKCHQNKRHTKCLQNACPILRGIPSPVYYPFLKVECEEVLIGLSLRCHLSITQNLGMWLTLVNHFSLYVYFMLHNISGIFIVRGHWGKALGKCLTKFISRVKITLEMLQWKKS